VQTVKPSGVDAMLSMPTKESVKFQRVADDSLFTIVCEFQQGDIALPFAEFLLRNLLSISPDHTHFALPLPQCDLATDDLPRLGCAVFAKLPFCKLPLVLAFSVVILAI
jgi:hypothetical protein